MRLTSAESTQLPKTIMQRTGPGKQNQVVFLLFCPVPKRQQVTVALWSPQSSEGSKSKSVKLQGQCNGFGCCVHYSIGNNWNVSGNSLKGWHIRSFQCVQDTFYHLVISKVQIEEEKHMQSSKSPTQDEPLGMSHGA